MSKVGSKSIEEVCSDCLYHSSSKGEVKMHDSKMDEIRATDAWQKELDALKKKNEKNHVPHPYSKKSEYYISDDETVIKKEPYSFETVLIDLARVYKAKNNDYGNSFGEAFEEFGIVSSVIRLNDKMSRLKSLQKNEQKVMDESIIDTLTDMANYAIMTIVELKNK